MPAIYCFTSLCYLLKILSPRKEYSVGWFGPSGFHTNLIISILTWRQQEIGSCEKWNRFLPKTLKCWLLNDPLNWWLWRCFNYKPQQKIQFTSWPRIHRFICMYVYVFIHIQDKCFSKPNLFLVYVLHSVLFCFILFHFLKAWSWPTSLISWLLNGHNTQAKKHLLHSM